MAESPKNEGLEDDFFFRKGVIFRFQAFGFQRTFLYCFSLR